METGRSVGQNQLSMYQIQVLGVTDDNSIEDTGAQ